MNDKIDVRKISNVVLRIFNLHPQLYDNSYANFGSKLYFEKVEISMATIESSASRNSWAYEEFNNLAINCGRLINRFIKTMETLSKKINESIAGASENISETKAIYRLTWNEKITEDVILNSHKKATVKRIIESEENTILSVQDTSELKYTSHKKTIGLGEYGTEKNSRGLIVHSNIAVTPDGIALGLLDQKIWARDPSERGKSNDNQKRPIEEKESYKWIESMEESNSGMPENVRIVNVCDREGDIFEFFLKCKKENKHFLVRATQNRNTDDEIKLFERVNNMASSGTVVVRVPRDTRKNHPVREAILEIRYTSINVVVPKYLKNKYKDLQYLEITIILAKEINAPEGISPIEWYLETNISINSFDDAVEKVRWYTQRWKIERFHYVLKNGCEVEELQQHDAETLKKLILMYSIISVRILNITYYARQNPEASCEYALDEDEWKLIYCMANKTNIPPNQIPTIKEAVGYIAKIGGFLGRKGDGDPGVKVIWKGLRDMSIVLQYKDNIPSK